MAKLNKKKVNKSNVKLAGLKSSFFSNESILLTSFGRGEQAVLEKKLLKEKVEFEKAPRKFQIHLDTSKIQIIGTKNEKGEISNPLITNQSKRAKKKLRKLTEQNSLSSQSNNHSYGQDQINAKKELEVIFYNQEFKDNIHIQVIYNILDIQKIISPFINDVVFSLDGLIRDKSQLRELRDFVGNLTGKFENLIERSGEKFTNFQTFIEKAKPLMPYFGEAFQIFSTPKRNNLTNSSNTEKIVYPTDKEIYTIIRCLSFIRHSIFHFKLEDNESIFRNQNYPSDIQVMIDSFFSRKVESINKSFFDNNSKSNFFILFQLYNIQDPTSQDAIKLAQKLYSFTVRKDQLNLGVSIRQLREEIVLLEEAKSINNKEFDTVRSKLYLFMDFLISEEYYQNSNRLLSMIQLLRSSKNDDEKDLHYKNEAIQVWGMIKNKVQNVLIPIMKNPKNFKFNHRQIDKKFLQSKLLTDQVTPFSKLFYLFSSFLDGKESNDLLTGLIHKLLEISSMQEFLNSGTNADYKNVTLKNMVSIFNQSRQLASELMLVKAMVHRSYDPVFNKQTLLEAAQIIGFKHKPQNLSDSDYLNSTIDQYKNNNFKNFLINNVISSRRFIYVVRYVNPQLAKKMASHKPSLLFVLKRIKSDQIDKYYYSLTNKNPSLVQHDEKINQLAEMMTTIHYEQFLSVVQGRPKGVKLSSPTPEENRFKEKQKAILGLYLTIIYLFFKGLIRVNSRYTIAFYAFERDNAIKLNNRRVFNLKENPLGKNSFLSLLHQFIENKRFKQRVNDYLLQNTNYFDTELFFTYRNNVAHLEVLNQSDLYFTQIHKVPSSYFEIYHTIMGLLFKHEGKFSPFTSEKLNSVFQYQMYSKDLLHILNLPFAYNLPRYKNLSIEVLFDQNENIDQAKK